MNFLAYICINKFKNAMEKGIFANVIGCFQGKYSGLEYRGTLVYYNGEARFDTEGYNLLYNLTRLCELLKEELV